MPFTFRKTEIDGIVVIDPQLYGDQRGFFLEIYRESDFREWGIADVFVQDNHSFSVKGVIRGLHYQIPPRAQAKLIYVVQGSVWDVAVDVRRGSPTFAKFVSEELSDENRRMMYIPEGFAHGFCALSDSVHIIYKCTREFSPEHDSGIRWDDEEIGIDWPTDVPILSERDRNLPSLREAVLFD
jgi:dTDP-4-dehydrorhamnose 3,5-epimerase